MPDVLVIGVGNLLRGDDAVGILVARKLSSRFGPEVVVREHHGDGADLLELWKEWESVIVVDAMSSGAAAGTVFRFVIPYDEAVIPSFRSGSTHTVGLGEAIELGRSLRALPKQLIVFGIEGEQFWLGSGISPPVSVQIEALVEMISGEVSLLSRQSSKVP